MENARPDGLPSTEPLWHTLSTADALAVAKTTERGLTKPEAAERLKQYGPNQMTPAPGRSMYTKIWEQLNNIINYILLIAAIISAAFGDWLDFGLILGVVVINVAIGVVQEGKAEKATQAIRAMTKTAALALRNNKRTEVDASELVPGDVVAITSGDRIPADVRWLECSDLQVTEAMLTGESAPVAKSCEPVDAEATLGDRICLGFTGTLVFTGQGTGLVVATGDRAEVGKLNTLITQAEVARTPLLENIESFGRVLSIACIFVAIFTFLLAYFARGYAVHDALVVGIGCAVALIPEGLPTVVTIALAVGVQAMAKQHAIIRQLPAVETLGSLTVICSDKTGTLTKNEMTAVGLHTPGGTFRVTGTGYTPEGDIKLNEDPLPKDMRAQLRQLLLPAVLCNDATLMPARSPDAQAMLATQAVTVPLLHAREQELVRSSSQGGPSNRDTSSGLQRLGTLEQEAIRMANQEAAEAAALASARSRGGRRDSAASASNPAIGKGDVEATSMPGLPNGRSTRSSSFVEASIMHAMTTAPVAWHTTGDPTEAALIAVGMKAGLNLRTINELSLCCERLDTVPFSSDTKFMATVHRLPIPASAGAAASAHKSASNGQRDGQGDQPNEGEAAVATQQSWVWERVMLIKGAPDVLLERCTTQAAGLDPWQSEPLELDRWLATAAALSGEGLRVLALCSLRVPMAVQKTAFTAVEVLHGEKRLHLHCLVSIMDPPRDEVAPAIREAHEAGIAVKMITGDHAETARTIGRQIGIETARVLTGAQMAAMSDAELGDQVENCNIYARATPEQKLRIVQALFRHGHVVAMTGDGVNDAPALKAASVGVAMGIAGTEVAKEASKMVLADDNFATIVAAVRRGRGVFQNLRKLLCFILPTSVAQGAGLTAAMVVGVPAPLTITQLLYVNVVTAISLGLVLAVEEPEPTVMQQPPRNQLKGLMGKLVLWRSGFIGLLLIVAILGQQQITLSQGGSDERGHTMALNTLVVSQGLYCLNCRFFTKSSMTWEAITTNPTLTTMIIITGTLQCLITYTPGVQSVFSTEAIDGIEWLRILAFGAAIFLIVEAEKYTKPAQYVIPHVRRAIAAAKARLGLSAGQSDSLRPRGAANHWQSTGSAVAGERGSAPPSPQNASNAVVGDAIA